MTCTNAQCEYKPTVQRKAIDQTDDQRRYGQLWAEIELPKLLCQNELRTSNPKQPNEANQDHRTEHNLKQAMLNKNRTDKIKRTIQNINTWKIRNTKHSVAPHSGKALHSTTQWKNTCHNPEALFIPQQTDQFRNKPYQQPNTHTI